MKYTINSITHEFMLTMANKSTGIFPIIHISYNETMDAINRCHTVHVGMLYFDCLDSNVVDKGTIQLEFDLSTDIVGITTYCLHGKQMIHGICSPYEWPTTIQTWIPHALDIICKHRWLSNTIHSESINRIPNPLNVMFAHYNDLPGTFKRIGDDMCQEWARLIHPFRIGVDGWEAIHKRWPLVNQPSHIKIV